ncbi:unnamed protein product [marine sediment metagenome]|uniref:LicD/FKTN/FKRP nucleotidyltransferase domain-containing protein n=1 Tax=marine sediment metagenome TaxID=412755 RepID=X1MIU4_9ZZZZ
MDIKAAKQTFLDIKKILDQAGIKFWLSDGTALGAVREARIISYDRDIDLRALPTEWDFPILFKKFENEGFRCVKSINPKLYKDKPSGSVIFKRGIKTDIGLNYYYPPEDLTVILAGRPLALITVVPAKFFRGDHFVEFLGVKARIPNPPEEYFEMHYGKDWKIPKNERYWKANIPISIAKYVKYFHEHPEVNQKKEKS